MSLTLISCQSVKSGPALPYGRKCWGMSREREGEKKGTWRCLGADCTKRPIGGKIKQMFYTLLGALDYRYRYTPWRLGAWSNSEMTWVPTHVLTILKYKCSGFPPITKSRGLKAESTPLVMGWLYPPKRCWRPYTPKNWLFLLPYLMILTLSLLPPEIASQINYVHPNACLRLLLRKPKLRQTAEIKIQQQGLMQLGMMAWKILEASLFYGYIKVPSRLLRVRSSW